MTQIPEMTSWAEATAAGLYKVAEDVANAPVPEHLGEERLSFARLAEDAQAVIDRLTDNSRIGRDRCLYVIALDSEADPEVLKEVFSRAKQHSSTKLPQDNNVISSTLYVGSSCATHKRVGTLRRRLGEHLLRAPKGTYALSLAEWASCLKGGLIVNAWQYPSFGDGLKGDKAARNIVLAVEDWLASELQPMLGRRGSRH